MLFKWLKQLEQKLASSDKQKSKLGWMVILGGAGVAIMLVSSFVGVKESAVQPEPEGVMPATAKPQVNHPMSSMQQYEREVEQQLSEVLGKIVGVDDVSVIVNLDSTEEEVVQIDERQSEQVTTERDKTGGNRSITQNTRDRKTAYYRNDDGERPVVVKKLKPKVRGVLVVARGVENLQVKAIVIEAVQRTLDIPMHRISVLPKG
ncbi:stage III sporulation protein AG [Laceyella sacchari]|uniref:Stage III sporulation protein AG n=1 Tax=Laceyella sacchari TaxID=37482 RepID=A0ABY5U7Z4_LACSH|nr:stage III sporulation protein AG [Laceyella sacchari]TCW41196.1 stage III sporulation protein AG [Laceyella sacchari]UWE04775.1 stage III sporulation protein AG [Laceyella sacchari]